MARLMKSQLRKMIREEASKLRKQKLTEAKLKEPKDVSAASRKKITAYMKAANNDLASALDEIGYAPRSKIWRLLNEVGDMLYPYVKF